MKKGSPVPMKKEGRIPIPDFSDLLKYDVSEKYINPQGERRKLLANAEKRASLIGYTEGFYIGKWKNHQYLAPLDGMYSKSVDDDIVMLAAVCAMNDWSEKQGKHVGLKKVVRANAKPVAGVILCLTLEGSDNQFYEAKVFKDIHDHLRVDTVRPALHYPYIDPAILKSFDAPDDSCDDHDPPHCSFVDVDDEDEDNDDDDDDESSH